MTEDNNIYNATVISALFCLPSWYRYDNVKL